MNQGLWSEQGSAEGIRMPSRKNFNLTILSYARQFAYGMLWVAEAEAQARSLETDDINIHLPPCAKGDK